MIKKRVLEQALADCLTGDNNPCYKDMTVESLKGRLDDINAIVMRACTEHPPKVTVEESA